MRKASKFSKRDFLKKAGLVTAGAAATTVAAPYVVKAQAPIKWRMQTYAGPALAEHVVKNSIDAFNKAANGEMVIELYTADQLVPQGELFRAVQAGTIDAAQTDDDSAAAPVDVRVFAAYFPFASRYSLDVPALWECKTMNARNWRETVSKGVVVAKPVYAAQIALYQAYMDAGIPGIATSPAMFTAINKDTAELHHELVPFDAALAQRMSDRGVRILQATDAGELLPRIARERDFHECRLCAWATRCWELPA